ncbi:MAG: aminopeptidase [Spirochaetota bacterium]
MKEHTYKFFFILSFLLLFSCSQESAVFKGSLSLQEAEKRYSANPEVSQFIKLARNVIAYSNNQYAMKVDERSLRFLPGSSESLAKRFIALPKQSLKPAIDALYYDTKALDAQKAKAEQSGLETFVQNEDPLWIAGKPAPLLESWARWPYDRQVERVFQVLFHQYVTTTVKQKDADGLSRFLAEKATEEYLLATLGGASPVLARYISEQRDEKTFATLFPDFAERVINLYTYRDPSASSESIEASRTQLLKVWIAEYKKRYTERFLTNRYGKFGDRIPGDAEILAIQHQLSLLGPWKEYQGQYRRAGETVVSYLKVVVKE